MARNRDEEILDVPRPFMSAEGLVTRVIVLYEVASYDGGTVFGTITSSNVTPWDFSGLTRWASDNMEPAGAYEEDD